MMACDPLRTLEQIVTMGAFLRIAADIPSAGFEPLRAFSLAGDLTRISAKAEQTVIDALPHKWLPIARGLLVAW
jgi:hypothetical protein